MLLKEEFAANMGFLEPSINSMIVAGEGEYQQTESAEEYIPC
jgi:hypothetical protein